jgi:hypothetical protein
MDKSSTIQGQYCIIKIKSYTSLGKSRWAGICVVIFSTGNEHAEAARVLCA